jgi:hypothetical protein
MGADTHEAAVAGRIAPRRVLPLGAGVAAPETAMAQVGRSALLANRNVVSYRGMIRLIDN